MAALPAESITIKDLFNELVGMRTDLTRVLTHMERIDTRNENADKMHADVEIRLRALERFRYTLGGLALIGGTAAGYVGYLLGHFVH
jgi:hypothetical protein